MANFAEDERRRYGVRPDSRTLHFSSPSFDASVLELMLAFGAGATMVIAPPTVYGGAELTALLRDERVTHAFVTPAALGSVDADALPELECVVTGGEACPPYLVEQWAPRHRMFNAYGPTEATVVSSVSDPLVVGQDVTIGCPPIGTGYWCSTLGCGRCRRVSPASCTCTGRGWPAVTTRGRGPLPNASWRTRSTAPDVPHR